MLTQNNGAYRVTEADGADHSVSDQWPTQLCRRRARQSHRCFLRQQRTTESTGDSSGSFISLLYNAAGRIRQVVDGGGQGATYQYDATGQHLTSYTDAFGTHRYGYVTGSTPVRNHALQSIELADGSGVFMQYDDFGTHCYPENARRVVKRHSFAYEALGSVTVNSATNERITQWFDDLGRLVRHRDVQGNTTVLRYDAADNVSSVILADTLEYKYAYDDDRNVIGTTDPLGYQTLFNYDSNRNLTSTTDALGRTTRYDYDAENNLTQILYANGSAERFAFDGDGNAISATNRRGQSTQYTYNAAGQVTRKVTADGQAIDLTYDALGQLTSARDSSGSITMEYTPQRALRKVTYPNGRFLEFEYTARGERALVRDQDGFAVVYTYDSLGRLERLGQSNGTLIVSYAYDAQGRLVRETHGNGTASTMEYNGKGQLTRLTHLSNSGAVQVRREYEYNTVGQRIRETRIDNDAQTVDGTIHFAYDAIGQLTSAQYPGGRTLTYSYDAVGNRTTVNDSGQLTRYSVNEMNEYTRIGDVIYDYDVDGNMTLRSDGATVAAYTFDSQNRLVNFSEGQSQASYHYDALGHRDAETTGGQTTQFLIDPTSAWNVAGEYNANGQSIARYTWGLGLVSRVDAGGASSYYDFDAVGNTLGMTDATGAYANRYDYLPFGESVLQRETIANRFEFYGAVGGITDASASIHLRYRNYDVSTGRFVSDDPAGIVAGDINLRRMTHNDPLHHVDPLGLGYYVGTGPATTIPGAMAANFQTNNPYMLGHTAYVTDNGRIYEFGVFGPVLGDPAGYTPDRLPPGHTILDPTHYDDSIMTPIYNDLIPDNLHPFQSLVCSSIRGTMYCPLGSSCVIRSAATTTTATRLHSKHGSSIATRKGLRTLWAVSTPMILLVRLAWAMHATCVPMRHSST